MEKTNKKTLEEIIRVDHAGERGAIKIYEGQLLALKTFKQNASLKRKIEEMKEHEREHYEYFDKEIKKRNIKPTKLLPLWDLMGVTLGFGTAMLGEKAAMLCTASVEEVIDGHYKDQTYKLGKDEEELKKKIMIGKFTGCKDLQEIRIYLYGISKVNSTFNGATTCRKFFCWFNFVFYKINRSNK